MEQVGGHGAGEQGAEAAAAVWGTGVQAQHRPGVGLSKLLSWGPEAQRLSKSPECVGTLAFWAPCELLLVSSPALCCSVTS